MALNFGGSPIAQAEIKLIDQTGQILTATTDADGKFSLPDASALTAPLLLAINDATRGRTFGVVLQTPTEPVTVNLNRFTRVAVQEAIGTNSGSIVADLPGSAKKLTVANVGAALAAQRTTFGPLVQALGGDPVAFDPFDPSTSTLVGSLTGLTANTYFDGKVFSWSTPAERWADDAPRSSVPTGTALPTPYSVETGVADALSAAVGACFAVPPAQRADFDSAGVATALKSACAGIPLSTAYQSIGRSFLARYSAILIDPTITGADASIDGYANGYDGQVQAVVGVNLYRANGSDTFSDRMSKIAGTWTLVGDGIPYRAFVQPYVERETYLNPAPAAPTDYFGTNYIATGLTARFNPAATSNTSDVRAVRVTGYGLPATGIVLARSTSCGRYDRMPIANKTGNVAITTTANRGDNFIVQAVRFDGSAVPATLWPASFTAHADVQRTDFDGRAYQPYRFELFRGTSQTPSESFVVRSSASFSLPNYAGYGSVANEWPTFDAATLRYLSPTDPLAAQTSSFTLTWAEAADGFSGPVTNVSVATRGTLAGETTLRRVNGGQANPVPGGATTATLNAADAVAADTNPCTASAYPALNDATGNFREFGLFWTQFGVRYYTGYNWSKF